MRNRDVESLCDNAIRMIARGDGNFLEQIYDTMAKDIYHIAYAVTVCHADAEDILQDTMLLIVKNAPTYRGGGARAWILTLARHKAIDLVRKRKSDVPLDEALATDKYEDNEETAWRNAMTLLETLDAFDRQIILLRLYREMPYADIAEIMGISAAATQKRYRRALAKLKKQF